MDYEIKSSNTVVTKGGVGSAVAGGLLFGGVGAIAGAVTGSKVSMPVISNVEVRMNVKDLNMPSFNLNITPPGITVKEGEFAYAQIKHCIDEIINLLETIAVRNLIKMTDLQAQKTKQQDLTVVSAADEIKKFK